MFDTSKFLSPARYYSHILFYSYTGSSADALQNAPNTYRNSMVRTHNEFGIGLVRRPGAGACSDHSVIWSGSPSALHCGTIPHPEAVMQY